MLKPGGNCLSQTIQQILNRKDDGELCVKLFDRLVGRYGERIDVSRLPDPHRVVVLVLGAKGIIENGGFYYLFSNDLDGDPHYELTAAAFVTIDCKTAIEAFSRVFALFDDGRPPDDMDRRLHEYLRGNGVERTQIDELFFSVGEDVEIRLAEFIRSRRDELARLDKKPVATVQKATKQRPNWGADGERTLIERLESLPHWARVALAARCARDLLPVFHRNWPDARPGHLAAVLRCVALAEESAVAGRKAVGVKSAQTNGYLAIGTAASAISSLIPTKENLPVDGNAAVAAANTARAALKACEAAGVDAKTSSTLAFDAIATASQVAKDAGQKKLLDQFSAYLRYLEHAAKARSWNHKAAVPDFTLMYAAATREPPKKGSSHPR